MLTGHIDVVPPGPAGHWRTDPFRATVADGRIAGRGAVDMKGGVAAMIMAVDVLRACGWEPAGSVVVESVVNEELGGYNGTLACCAKGYAGDAAIVLEPTGLDVAPASKGGQVYRATVTGKPAHSAFWWQGTSALDKALVLKAALGDWERLRAVECADAPFFGSGSDDPLPARADMVWSLTAGDPEVMAHPETAELLFWVDLLPGESREQLLARFERFVRDATSADRWLAEHPVRLSRATMRPFLGNAVDPDGPVVQSLLRAAEQVGVRSRRVGFPGACDAMIFNLHSTTPAVIFGPGDLALAHAPDERLPVAELLRCVEALALAIADFCG
jgi:acetylornithine deacetylase